MLAYLERFEKSEQVSGYHTIKETPIEMWKRKERGGRAMKVSET
jgi:hypothetical protein